MEIVFYEIPDNFSKCTVVFNEENVILSYKSLIRQYKREFKYSDLIEIIRVKEGDKGWGNVGVSLLAIAFFTLLFLSYYTVYARTIAAVIAITSIIPFIMRYQLKEWIYFSNENSEYSFSIKVTQGNKSDVENAIKLVQDKNNSKKNTSKRTKKS